MRRCVVVLGPGRSGTSLAMQLLAASGLRLSQNLVPASADNPDGHFEDQEIRDQQQLLLSALRLSPYAPRPPDWRKAAPYAEVRSELVRLVDREVSRDERLWGFKDPRSCVLWPLWQEVFGATDVSPTVIMAMRRGMDVIRSMMTSYDLSQDVAEGIYVLRFYHAMRDAADGWFFLHYERWRDDPAGQMERLARHCSLDAWRDAPEIIDRNYRPELDRRSKDAPLRLSGMVNEIDELVKPFNGHDYDEEAIECWCESFERRLTDMQFLVHGVERLRSQASTSPRSRLLRKIRKS